MLIERLFSINMFYRKTNIAPDKMKKTLIDTFVSHKKEQNNKKDRYCAEMTLTQHRCCRPWLSTALFFCQYHWMKYRTHTSSNTKVWLVQIYQNGIKCKIVFYFFILYLNQMLNQWVYLLSLKDNTKDKNILYLI